VRCADCDLELLEDSNTYTRLVETIDEYGEVIRAERDRLCETCFDFELYDDGDDFAWDES
jgi:hypothetical protein